MLGPTSNATSTIRDLLWLTAVVALSIGYWYEHARHAPNSHIPAGSFDFADFSDHTARFIRNLTHNCGYWLEVRSEFDDSNSAVPLGWGAAYQDSGARAMRFLSLLLFGVIAVCAGCTTMSLKRNALSHSGSTADLRYREVLENLALIANNPWALPSYSSIYAGTTEISDTIPVGSATNWSRSAAGVTTFNSQAIDFPASRQVKENWTLDPTIVPEKLEAIRAASWWMLFGPAHPYGDSSMLGVYGPCHSPPGYYFNVASELANLPAGWVRIGACNTAPRCAIYQATSHGTTVWVMPEDMGNLSAFTLVLQLIARADLTKLHAPQLSVRTLKLSGDQISADQSRQSTIKQVTVYVDQNGLLTADANSPAVPIKSRLDNFGQDAGLRSLINTASKGP